MGIMTCTVNTTRVERSNEGFPLCKCGQPFQVYDHYRKRKPKEIYASVAACPTPSCEYHDSGFIGYDYDHLKKKVNEFLPTLPSVR